MARARNIKPAFFHNDKLSELDPLARLAFIGMWTIANFKGCIEYRPKMLKVQILPYDVCDIELLVNNLEQARFIRFYAEQGKKYIKIVNFEKHQNPHKNERDAGSDIPDITELNSKNIEMNQDGTKPDLIGTKTEPLVLIPDSLLLNPDSLNPDSLIPENGFPSKDMSTPSASTVAKKGTKLPDDWVLPKAWGEWALADKPDRTSDEVRLLADGFKDYWLANANQAKAKKADWQAAWRIWTRSPYNKSTQRDIDVRRVASRRTENDRVREAARKILFGSEEKTIETI